MKEIKTIFQPFLVSRLLEALKEIDGMPGVTVSDVRGSAAHNPLVPPKLFIDGNVLG